MVTAEEAGKILREYFANVTPEQFVEDVRASDPEFWAEMQAAREAEAKGITLAVPTSFPVHIPCMNASIPAPKIAETQSETDEAQKETEKATHESIAA